MINLSDLSSQLQEILNYLHRNAWTIVFIIFGGYFIWNNFINPYIEDLQARQSYKSAIDPHRVAVLSPDMKRIRADQQRIANENAVKAEEDRKVKAKEVKERKRVKSPEEERWDKLGGTGKKLGGGAAAGGAKKTR